MKITAQRTERILKLRLDGDLDHHAAREIMGQLDREVDMALPRKTELDLSGLTFMDSSGIAVIMRLYRRVQDLDGVLTIINVPQQAKKVLYTSGIEQILRMEKGEGQS